MSTDAPLTPAELGTLTPTQQYAYQHGEVLEWYDQDIAGTARTRHALATLREQSAVVPVVAAVIHDGEGRYLIGKRKPDQWMGNRWCFVGGKIEPGESAELAVVREVHEEIGVTVEIVKPRRQALEAYEHGTFALNYFDCFVGPCQPRAIEVSEWAWVDAVNLPTYDLLPVDCDIANEIALTALREQLRWRDATTSHGDLMVEVELRVITYNGVRYTSGRWSDFNGHCEWSCYLGGTVTHWRYIVAPLEDASAELR